jgi:cell division septation protein DedD
MNWPTHTDYQDAIQNPPICFAEDDLKAGTAACDMLGLPRVTSGNFASVYELSAGDKRYAVRCFVRQVSGQQGRYARLCEHLGKVKMPWLVDFNYFLKGIMVRGEWFPVVKMDWVEGSPLNTWIEDNLIHPEKLKAAAGQWRTLVSDMRKNHLAHGDYQHGNIMVTTKDELRLVDYDGMYCPAFGKGRSPELGHANFQHPRRLAEHYDDSIDNFSAIVIYLSLLALAEEPQLWKDFYTVDNLLLLSSDYKNPQNSKAFARLEASKNPVVKQLATLLKNCCMRSVQDVPWFEDAVTSAEKGTVEAQVAAMPQPSAGPEGINWLDDSETAPGAAVSRPSPATRPSPAPAAAQSSAKPAPKPAAATTKSAPAPSKPSAAPQPSYASQSQSGEKSGVPGWVMIVGVLVLVGIIVAIVLTRKH